MTSTPLILEIQPGLVLVRVTLARIADEKLVTQLGAKLSEALVAKPGLLILDFSAVDYVSSIFIGVLSRLNVHLRQDGGKLVVFGLKPALRQLFRLTKLDHVFLVVATEAEAKEQVKFAAE